MHRALLSAALLVALEAAWQTVVGPFGGKLSNKSGAHWLIAFALFAAATIAKAPSVLRFDRVTGATTRLVFLLAVCLFLGNTRLVGATDSVPNQFVPYALVQHGTLALDAYPDATHAYNRDQPCVRRYGDHLLSCAAVMIAIVATPVFAPAAVVGDPSSDEHRTLLEKLSAALLAALSVVFMWRVFLRVTSSPQRAAWATLAYTAATPMLSIVGQALWQHTGAVLGFSIAMYGLYSERHRALLVGIGCGLAVASRQIALLAVPGVLLALYLSERRVRDVVVACAAAAPFALFLFAYNAAYFGSPFSTGYGEVGDLFILSSERFFGFLVSPARGFLLYCPLIGFAIVALRKNSLVLSVLTYVVALGSWIHWGGPYSAGPRLMTDVLPMIGVGLALAIDRFWRSRTLRAAAIYSLAMHLLLAYVAPKEKTKQLLWNVESGAWPIETYAPIAFAVGFMEPKPAKD